MKTNRATESKVKAKVGNVVRQARTDAGLSPKDFAEKADIYQNDVSAIENGNRNVTIVSLNNLADALDADLEFNFVPRK